jgi:hypothetical protein
VHTHSRIIASRTARFLRLLAGISDRARLFALTNMAMADALLCLGHEAAVQLLATERCDSARQRRRQRPHRPDPTWTTYFSRNPTAAQNPDYPDYTSGANNLTGAMTGMLALFFYIDKPSRSFNVYATAPTVPRAAGDEDRLVYKKTLDKQ